MRTLSWWAWTLLRGALLLSAPVLLVATALPAWRTDQWLVRYLGYPTLQVMAVSAGLALLLAVLPNRGWPGSRGWSRAGVAGLLLAAGWNGALLAPYLLPLVGAGPAVTVPAGSCPDQHRLRVFSANVQMTNRRDGRLLQMVREADPDIVWFQETDGWWENELAPLAAVMPHGAARTQANYYGVHLFSRLPLSDVAVQTLTNSRNPSVAATVTLPSGRTVRIHAIHPRPPQPGQSTAERDGQLMATALQARADAIPHVVVGDLNAVPWEDALHRTERVAGVRDPRVGRGLFITWNAHRWLAKWPLDHILPGEGITLSALRVLPAFGSDHLPMVADLCIPERAAPLPPLGDEERRAAEATIARGQGKALPPNARDPLGAGED